MKILRIVPVFHPPKSMYGHSVTFYMLSKAQVDSGNKVTVLSPKASASHQMIDGIAVRYIEHNPRFLSFFGFQEKLKREIASFGKGAEIVHSHGKVALALNSEALGCPHIVHLHDTPFALEQSRGHQLRNPKSYLYDRRKKLLYSRYLKRASAVIAYSHYVRNHAIRNYRIPPEKITVVRNGISDLFNPKNGKLTKEMIGLPHGSKVILYVGRIVNVRGIFLAVQAFALLRKSMADTHLLVIGNSAESGIHKLQTLVTDLHLKENITHIKHVEYTELPSYYQMSDLHIAAGNYMGYPKTIMESLACGTPVVANDNEDIRSIVASEDSLVRELTPESLAKSMSTVLSSDRIKGEVQSTADSNSKRFSWKVTSEKISKIYSALLEDHLH